MAAHASSLPLPQFCWIIAGLAAVTSLVHTTICTLNDICDRKIDAQVGEYASPEYIYRL